jgi:hypothetical protein
VQVFGGPQAAGLDLALDVFGTLSVTMEDLPKDGAAAPVDDASDQIILPVRFLPANAQIYGIAVVDQTYASGTTQMWILIHQIDIQSGCWQPAGFLQQQLQQFGAQRAASASTLQREQLGVAAHASPALSR